MAAAAAALEAATVEHADVTASLKRKLKDSAESLDVAESKAADLGADLDTATSRAATAETALAVGTAEFEKQIGKANAGLAGDSCIKQ